MSERFEEHARRLREELDAEPFTPPELEAGRRRVLGAKAPRSKKPLLLLAPALAAAIAAVVVIMRPQDTELVIAQGADCVTLATNTLDIAECPTNVELKIGRAAEDLSFRSGRARFSVDKRPTHPFQIAVSHGTIVVIGTRFSVDQKKDRGRIEVEEGIVEFRWNDGAPADRLTAGATLDWPRPTTTATTATTIAKTNEPEPEPEPEPDRRRTKHAPKLSTDALMRRLFQLRSQRRWDEAIALLADGTRRADFTEAQKERLSFELGTVLRQAGREQEACTHLHKHLVRFPKSTQRQQISRDCP